GAEVDLEKLRMSGAGKAIAVLTSGGDAQGERPHARGGGARALSTEPRDPPQRLGQCLGHSKR
uniref:Uncharacterized protein n=1 Tax=Ornithorhynchus anatinus TaxID=9258 RepID=A0A6I8NDT7_ORNAN